jgi:hypothetical protein
MTVVHVRERLIDVALRLYHTYPERVAMRGALADAAAICDAVAKDIEENNPKNRKKGTVTAPAARLADVARACGTAIWNMRDRIEVQDG